MKRTCYSPEMLSELLEASPADPRLAHVHSCIRCRNLMESLRAFRSPSGEVPPHELDDAEARMRATLEREMKKTQTAATPWARAWMALFGGAWWRPALAAAAVVLLVVAAVELHDGPERSPSGTVRGEMSATFSAQAEDLAGGGVRLSWDAVNGAGAYRVVFSDLGLEEIKSWEAGDRQSLTLEAAELQALAPAGTQVLCRVVALRQGSVLASSSTVAVTIP